MHACVLLSIYQNCTYMFMYGHWHTCTLHQQIQNRDRKLVMLQTQVSDLNKELAVKEAEGNNQQQTIKMLQDKHRSSAGEVSVFTLQYNAA